jgi:hypothetical protein
MKNNYLSTSKTEIMKTTNLLITLFIISIFYSCCTDCDDEGGSRSFSTIYQEKSLPGFLKINGADVFPSEINSTNNSASDELTFDDVPGQNISALSVRMFVPTDDSVTIEAQVGDVLILKNDGVNAPPFFEGGTIDGQSDDFNEGFDRQGYTYNFTYPNNAPTINKSNLTGLSFEFHFVYTDTATGEILENKTYKYDVAIRFN